jgi:short subunit dehydrogenase-like uncharacterized protein
MKLDLRVTAALLFAMFAQTGGALVWAGRASARLDEVEARLDVQRPVVERLARLETQMAQVQASLARIEDRMEKR